MLDRVIYKYPLVANDKAVSEIGGVVYKIPTNFEYNRILRVGYDGMGDICVWVEHKGTKHKNQSIMSKFA